MRRSSTSLFLLQLSLGIMFVLLGIAAVSGASSYFGNFVEDLVSEFTGNPGVITTVIGVLEIVAGSLLLLSLFGLIKENIMQILLVIILALWGVELVLAFVLGGNLLQPDLLTWLEQLAPNLVIFAGLLVVFEQRR